MDVIRLKNMVFYGYHGLIESEKDLGGKFEIDLELFRPLRKAGRTDDLQNTINYESIFRTVETYTKEHKFYLIEALADSVAKAILDNYDVAKVIIRVRKPHAPVHGILDTVEVEMTRTKTDYV